MGLDCLVPFPFFGGDFHGLHVKLLLSAAAPPAPPHTPSFLQSGGTSHVAQ